MKYPFLMGILLCAAASASGQNTAVDNMDTVQITGNKLRFKKQQLYDESNGSVPAQIGGFSALGVFDESMGSEVWFSKEKACVSVSKSDRLPYTGQFCLHAQWDKIAGGCKWIGMGIGWDNWQPKDISSIVDSAAIQIMLRSETDTLKTLPLALALEDYTGAQCFIGFSPRYLMGNKIMPGGWTAAIIPLSEFPFERFNASAAMIKQFIIQFEADGNVYMDDIRLIRKK
ncbi:MAG: hypothetical protein EBV15_00230 [Bacteroidetes bacterium]|jgi:hypothetical protein|nr:hypothetical protein [Bacteroidota bacterium]